MKVNPDVKYNTEANNFLWQIIAFTGIAFFVISLVNPNSDLAKIIAGMMFGSMLTFALFVLHYIVRKYDIDVFDNRLIKKMR